jgi:hypothetical protein
MIKVGVVGRADERPIRNSTAIGLAACQKLRIIQCEAVSDEKSLPKELCWHFDDSIKNKLSVRLVYNRIVPNVKLEAVRRNLTILHTIGMNGGVYYRPSRGVRTTALAAKGPRQYGMNRRQLSFSRGCTNFK